MTTYHIEFAPRACPPWNSMKFISWLNRSGHCAWVGTGGGDVWIDGESVMASAKWRRIIVTLWADFVRQERI